MAVSSASRTVNTSHQQKEGLIGSFWIFTEKSQIQTSELFSHEGLFSILRAATTKWSQILT